MEENEQELAISFSNYEEIELSTDCLTSEQDGGIVKRVRFDSQVWVHKHALILGDNPAVSDGVPLQLAWEAEGMEVWELQDNDKRRRMPPKLSSYVRKVIASDQSSRNCLVQVREEVRAIQKSRRESARPKVSLFDIFFGSSKLYVTSKSHMKSKGHKSHMFFTRM